MRSRLNLIPFCIFFILLGMLSTLRTTEAADPVIVGVLHSTKYPYATMMKNSYEMAQERINKQGGIKGRPLKLIYADDQSTRDAGEKAVRELVKINKAVMLIGGYASSNTIYTAGLANKLNVPFLITTAADDRITQRKWRNVYRMNPPAQEYAKGVEKLLLQDIQPQSLAIVYENSPYGTGGALQMMWFCRENDIPIRKIIPYHKEKASPEYFEKLLSPLQEDTPEIIYMVSYLNDGATMVNKLKELQIKSLLIGGAGGFTHQKFIETAGESANKLLTATLWTQQLSYPGTKEYYEQYLQKHSVPPDYHGAEAYSAPFIVADVLNRAQSFRPESIREAMDATDFTTPFGPVKFESYGKFERQNSLPTMVLQVINGKFEVVAPGELATAELLKN